MRKDAAVAGAESCRFAGNDGVDRCHQTCFGQKATRQQLFAYATMRSQTLASMRRFEPQVTKVSGPFCIRLSRDPLTCDVD
jgi:hypothetical protein